MLSAIALSLSLPLLMPALLLQMGGLDMSKTIKKDNETIKMLDFKKASIISLTCWVALIIIIANISSLLNY